jgi:DNA repair protein RadA/Sms
MAKAKSVFVCAECGASALKWMGMCPSCGEAGTLSEQAAERGARAAGPAAQPVALADIEAREVERVATGLAELDRVLGGGLVAGQVTLIGGDPGIGKSTLLLQALAALGEKRKVLYVSGEESAEQVALRARRLGVGTAGVGLLAEIQLERVLGALQAARPEVAVVDSIQTLWSDTLQSAPGSVAQVRECAAQLTRHAKKAGAALFIVGHVTKEGAIAGPRVLEHIVDTVLYFEGEGTQDHRIIRATKNRFGGVDEIGVFHMTQEGLAPVENPSALFVGARDQDSSGTAVAALLEGTRPLLVEIQALAARAGFGTPQRVANGFDGRRLAMLLAVLEKRAGIPFGQLDVFVNVAGGLRIVEPAGDLAVAAALASSVHDRPLPPGSVFIGEVGLGGEIRPVSQTERRIAEAERMGLGAAYLSERGAPSRNGRAIRTITAPTIGALLERLLK